MFKPFAYSINSPMSLCFLSTKRIPDGTYNIARSIIGYWDTLWDNRNQLIGDWDTLWDTRNKLIGDWDTLWDNRNQLIGD